MKERLGSKIIGFGSNNGKVDESLSLMQQVTPEDLLKFGLIPEFIGRLPVMAMLEKLTEFDLVNILTEPKNAIIKQYQRLFEIDGVVLEFDEDALEAIASLAIERNTGARGLRAIIESIMLNIMFEVPSHPEIKRVVITKEVVDQQASPLYYNAKKKKIALKK